MNKAVLGVWLVLPLGAWAYHEGPGQDRMTLDEVDGLVAAGYVYVQDEMWVPAVEKYEKALAQLPEEQAEAAWRIRLELDKARMMAAQLPAAHADLVSLVEDLSTAEDADAKLLADAQSTLANARYYMTWLLRLEGQPRERWEREIEAARQSYRLLAEQALDRSDAVARQKHEKDLESAIRLARMELKDLQGLPLPSQ